MCSEDIQNQEVHPDWNEALTLLRNNWANEMVIKAYSENNDHYESKGRKLNLRICFRESFHAVLISQWFYKVTKLTWSYLKNQILYLFDVGLFSFLLIQIYNSFCGM